MQALLLIVVVWATITGCGWTPDRSNPYDPMSTNYVLPRQANRPPVVDTLIVNTECLNLPLNDDCAIIIKAFITDLDENLVLNGVSATIDGRQFGRLSWDAPGAFWILTRLETELDSAPEKFVSSNVVVSAIDDSGAIGQRSLTFPGFNLPYPSINWPHDFECICPQYHDFSWIRWNGQGQAQNYEIRFYLYNFIYQSHLTIRGIDIADTNRPVDLLFEPADGNDALFYGWRLFIYDAIGNSAGSLPQTFKYYTACNDSCVGP